MREREQVGRSDPVCRQSTTAISISYGFWAHYFHAINRDPDTTKHITDDPNTTNISWPNFHSGANGDFQEIEIVGRTHPHEGGIGAPEGEGAREEEAR